MKPQYQEIPEELRALSNWIVWRIEQRSNKAGAVRETKVPYSARSHKLAKSNDSATWSSFGDATAALERGYTGLGFCLTPPYVGVDLDGCRKGGIEEPWAKEIILELDSYSELSPSTTGVHVIAKGELPEGPRQKNFDGEHHGVGLYDASRGRYLTMTGIRIRGNAIAERTAELRRIHARLFPPAPPRKPKATGSTTDDELVTRARNTKDGGKFQRLWDGRWEGDYTSQSEADLALCTKLAFWTRRDAGRIDALFRRSGLMREKWNRKDYRDSTIAKAIEQTSETWNPKAHHAAPFAATVDLNRLDASLDLLNSLAIWQGRIRIASVKRRGPMVIATTDTKTEIIWPTTTDLGSFSKSQAIVSDATSIWIQTPPHRQIRSQWEPAVHLLLQLSAKDGICLESPLKEEVRDLLRLIWHAAGQPVARDGGQFIEYIRIVRKARRNPMGTIPPCVFVAEESAWVHVPAFRAWLSIPALTNKLYPLADIRNGLMLLGFAYFENLSRGFDGDSETACLWRGPLDSLET